jgi:hypothetical protein
VAADSLPAAGLPARAFPAALPATALGRMASCGGAISRAAAGVTSRSRTTSAAGLSSRRPWKDGCRILPSDVHSLNVTSATSSGRTQWGLPTPVGRSSKGDVGCSSVVSRFLRSRSVWPVNPVPTLPT